MLLRNATIYARTRDNVRFEYLTLALHFASDIDKRARRRTNTRANETMSVQKRADEVWIQFVVAKSDEAFASLDAVTRRHQHTTCLNIIRLIREVFEYGSRGERVCDEGDRADSVLEGVRLLRNDFDINSSIHQTFDVILFIYYEYPESARMDGIQVTHAFTDALLVVDDTAISDTLSLTPWNELTLSSLMNDDPTTLANYDLSLPPLDKLPSRTFCESTFSAEVLRRWPRLLGDDAVQQRKSPAAIAAEAPPVNVLEKMAFGWNFHRYVSYESLEKGFVGSGGDGQGILRNSPFRLVRALMTAVVHRRKQRGQSSIA